MCSGVDAESLESSPEGTPEVESTLLLFVAEASEYPVEGSKRRLVACTCDVARWGWLACVDGYSAVDTIELAIHLVRCCWGSSIRTDFCN